MPRIIALFNLKPGVEASEYEDWARRVDIPTVNGLKSIESFGVFRSTAVLGSDTPPPFQYIEIIDINNMKDFSEDIATEKMKSVAAAFGALADATFITTELLTRGQ